MKLQHYADGHWTEREITPAWEDGDDSDTWLKKAGYEDLTQLGSDYGASVQLWQRESEPRYLVSYSDWGTGGYVTAASWAEALDLMARWAPMITADAVGSALSDLHSLDSYGIVTRVLAALELHAGTAQKIAQQKRQEWAESARLARQRRAERAAQR